MGIPSKMQTGKMQTATAAAVVLISVFVVRIAAAPQEGRGLGAERRDDPCTHLPDPAGKAKGIEKQCPDLGSSSGVMKGDFNGDGFTDLAIGEPGATIHGFAGAGDVIVLYGSANGLGAVKKDLWYEGPDRSLLLNTLAAGNGFGSALAAGDFNGDGFTDLAIGAPNEGVFDRINFGSPHHGAGTVTVIYGSANGLTTTDTHTHVPQFVTLANTDPTCLSDPGLRCEIQLDNAHFGQALSWGNYNGDLSNGRPVGDLAIGLPGAVDIANSPRQGAVIIVLGHTSGLQTNNTGLLFEDTSGVDTVGASSPADAFGASLSSGDFDGDGNTDLAVGCPGRVNNGLTGAGAVFILSKLNTQFGVMHAFTLGSIFGSGSEQAGASFGAALTSGDFNGDTKADLAIGLPNFDDTRTNSGAVLVLDGTASAVTDASPRHTISSSQFHGVAETGAHFGTALVSGDFDGDGFSDLAIGVPFKDIVVSRSGQNVTLTDAGEVDIVYGSPTSLSFAHAQVWNQETVFGAGKAAAGNRFGAPLTAWNFGNNEVSIVSLNGNVIGQIPRPTTDLAVGVPFQTVNGVSGAGAVNVLFGSFFNGGLGTFFTPKVLSADSVGFGGTAGAHFGAGLY